MLRGSPLSCSPGQLCHTVPLISLLTGRHFILSLMPACWPPNCDCKVTVFTSADPSSTCTHSPITAPNIWEPVQLLNICELLIWLNPCEIRTWMLLFAGTPNFFRHFTVCLKWLFTFSVSFIFITVTSWLSCKTFTRSTVGKSTIW